MSRPRLLILIDALGWEYLKEGSFLSDILPYRTPLRTVLGFSSGAIPAILTGRTPQSNGLWNLYYHDPAGSPFRWVKAFRWLPARVLDNRYTRKLIKEAGRRVLGLGANFECNVPVSLLPYFNISEKRNIYEPQGLIGNESVFDWLRDKQVPFRTYSYHRYSDAEIFSRALADVRSRRYDFYFLYLAEMDAFLHQHCRDREKVEAKLQYYAERLRQLITAARNSHPDILCAVFSDHGMTPTRATYDLVAEIEQLGYRTPQDLLAVYDSTMARFWFFNSEARQAVTRRLAELPCGRILSDRVLETLGLLFSDRRYGELIFLMNPGTLMARNNFNTRYLPAGMHGYHPDDPWSDAAFLSSEPPARPPRSIIDLYGFMTHGYT